MSTWLHTLCLPIIPIILLPLPDLLHSCVFSCDCSRITTQDINVTLASSLWLLLFSVFWSIPIIPIIVLPFSACIFWEMQKSGRVKILICSSLTNKALIYLIYLKEYICFAIKANWPFEHFRHKQPSRARHQRRSCSWNYL